MIDTFRSKNVNLIRSRLDLVHLVRRPWFVIATIMRDFGPLFRYAIYSWNHLAIQLLRLALLGFETGYAISSQRLTPFQIVQADLTTRNVTQTIQQRMMM